MKLPRFTLAILLLFAVRLEAHEIGNTRVSASFPEGKAYEIEIITDAAALVEKLEIMSGISSPPESARKAVELETLLPGYEETFRRRVLVAFDGNAVRPAIQYSVSGEPTATTSPVAVIKLIGELPHGAREFEWTWSWTFATYSLTAGESTEWLEGGQPSAPVLLTTGRQTRSRASTGVQYLTLGFNTHRSARTRSHVVRARNLFPDAAVPRDSEPGHRLHDRSLHHTGTKRLWPRLHPDSNSGAADCRIDCVRRHRKHLHVGTQAVARSSHFHFRPASWNGVRRCVERAGPAACGICDGSRHVQYRSRSRPACRDRYRISGCRLVLRPPAMVSCSL